MHRQLRGVSPFKIPSKCTVNVDFWCLCGWFSVNQPFLEEKWFFYPNSLLCPFSLLFLEVVYSVIGRHQALGVVFLLSWHSLLHTQTPPTITPIFRLISYWCTILFSSWAGVRKKGSGLRSACARSAWFHLHACMPLCVTHQRAA